MSSNLNKLQKNQKRMSVCKIKFDLSLREAEGLRELILTYRSISRENLRSVFTPELRKGLIEERSNYATRF